MAGNGNGSGVDLLLRAVSQVAALEKRTAEMEHTIGVLGQNVTAMGLNVEALSRNVGALSEQVHEFRVGVAEMGKTFEGLTSLMRELMAKVERIEKNHESRIAALESK